MSSPLDFRWLGRTNYADVLSLQESLVKERLDREIGDCVLFLEHDSVYTIGRRPDQSSLRNGEGNLPYPVVEISRGGQATYHGPGQLVIYPILNLRDYGQDLHRYLRALEDSIVAACRAMGVNARRREELTGAWVEERKLASVGVGVKRWISMHGVAINIAGDLSPFEKIVPCGLGGVVMTSLEKELGAHLTVERAARTFWPHFEKGLKKLRESAKD